jgi:predicted regulator of Ras-like GTPase activity (Roadblock/LC7/MglB family)
MQIDLSHTYEIGGFLASCLVDSNSGLMLASEGGGSLDLEAVAALNTNFLKAKLAAIDALGLNDHVEDILITLGRQVHFIRPLEKVRGAFLYVALEKKAANIGMARIQVRKIENSLSF